jgi:hypothetical protein
VGASLLPVDAGVVGLHCLPTFYHKRVGYPGKAVYALVCDFTISL